MSKVKIGCKQLTKVSMIYFAILMVQFDILPENTYPWPAEAAGANVGVHVAVLSLANAELKDFS